MGILQAIQGRGDSYAILKGNEEHQNLIGKVEFFSWSKGTIVKLEIIGLPNNKGENNFFAFHIHEKANCEEPEDNFPNTGEHYTKDVLMHPNHTGDLPMIYSNDGYSFMIYYTSRFTPKDVIGKSVVIHSGTDDMMAQPSGNSGIKIACGEIIKT